LASAEDVFDGNGGEDNVVRAALAPRVGNGTATPEFIKLSLFFERPVTLEFIKLSVLFGGGDKVDKVDLSLSGRSQGEDRAAAVRAAAPSPATRCVTEETKGPIYNEQYKCRLDLEGDLVVPDRVCSIGRRAFMGCSRLSGVAMLNSVTEIGSRAFHQCATLETFDMSNSIETIEDETFSGCSLLKSVRLSTSAKLVGIRAFSRCTALAQIHLPESLKYIGGEAFAKCASLLSVVVPEAVSGIGTSTFADCTSLRAVTLPNSLRMVGLDAFEGCHESLVFVHPPCLVTVSTMGGDMVEIEVDKDSGGTIYRTVDDAIAADRDQLNRGS
jgi:hypothetical protein